MIQLQFSGGLALPCQFLGKKISLEAWKNCNFSFSYRNRVGVAVMDEFLYAVGGSSGTEYHNSVE